MYMGIVKLPFIANYWSTDPLFKSTFVQQVMSRNRFQLINRFLYFAPGADARPDRLTKFRKVVGLIEQNFVAAKIPGEDIVVDETMIPWRGRLLFRQYNPWKSHKYGIKIYKLYDSSGYVYTTEVYTGKDDINRRRGAPTETATH